MAEVVPIEKVIAQNDFHTRTDVRKMRAVLEKQGQIEPLQVRVYSPDSYITHEKDPWASALVKAAQELSWATLLIVVTERYIP